MRVPPLGALTIFLDRRGRPPRQHHSALSGGGRTTHASIDGRLAGALVHRRQRPTIGSLADAGLGAEDIPQMIEIALSVRRLLDPNPVTVEESDAEAIYRNVLA